MKVKVKVSKKMLAHLATVAARNTARCRRKITAEQAESACWAHRYRGYTWREITAAAATLAVEARWQSWHAHRLHWPDPREPVDGWGLALLRELDAELWLKNVGEP